MVLATAWGPCLCVTKVVVDQEVAADSKDQVCLLSNQTSSFIDCVYHLQVSLIHAIPSTTVGGVVAVEAVVVIVAWAAQVAAVVDAGAMMRTRIARITITISSSVVEAAVAVLVALVAIDSVASVVTMIVVGATMRAPDAVDSAARSANVLRATDVAHVMTAIVTPQAPQKRIQSNLQMS